MKYKSAFYKQVDNGNIAHLYEHIIANGITSKLLSNHLYRSFDYQLDANHYDGVIMLALYYDNKKVIKIAKNVLNSFKYTKKDISNNISQISIELKKSIKFDESLVTDELIKLHRQPWLDYKSMNFTKYPSDGARSFKTKSISTDKSIKNDITTYQLVYALNDCPEFLRPLSIYVLESVGLTVIDQIYHVFPDTYDDGDEWAKHQPLIGYLTNISFVKVSNRTKKQFSDIQHKVVHELSDPSVAKRIAKFASDSYASLDPHFSEAEMYDRAGHFVGIKEFSNESNTENVIKILEAIEVTSF